MVGNFFVNTTVLDTSIESVSWLVQAIGGIVVIYLGFAVVNFILNWKKNKEITRIGKDVREIKMILKKSKKR